MMDRPPRPPTRRYRTIPKTMLETSGNLCGEYPFVSLFPFCLAALSYCTWTKRRHAQNHGWGYVPQHACGCNRYVMVHRESSNERRRLLSPPPPNGVRGASFVLAPDPGECLRYSQAKCSDDSPVDHASGSPTVGLSPVASFFDRTQPRYARKVAAEPELLQAGPTVPITDHASEVRRFVLYQSNIFLKQIRQRFVCFCCDREVESKERVVVARARGAGRGRLYTLRHVPLLTKHTCSVSCEDMVLG